MKRWCFIIGITLLVGLVGGGVWLYQHPPLAWGGSTTGFTLDGIGLQNRGRWPVRLTSVTIAGTPQPDSIRMIKSFTAHMADNVPMGPQPNDQYVYGTIEGWRIEPWIGGRLQPTDAIVVDWAAIAPPPAYPLQIHYRYLGLPMTLSLEHKR